MIFFLHEFRFFSNTLIKRRYSLVFSILPSHLYMDEIFDSICTHGDSLLLTSAIEIFCALSFESVVVIINFIFT